MTGDSIYTVVGFLLLCYYYVSMLTCTELLACDWLNERLNRCKVTGVCI